MSTLDINIPFFINIRKVYLTLCEQQVGSERLLVVLLEEDLPLWDVTQQQLHRDAELEHGVPESLGRVLWRLPQGLHEVLVGLGVLQLDGLDAAEVVQVAGPLVVAGALGEHALGDQLGSLGKKDFELLRHATKGKW